MGYVGQCDDVINKGSNTIEGFNFPCLMPVPRGQIRVAGAQVGCGPVLARPNFYAHFHNSEK